MILETARLFLRELTPADCDVLLLVRGLPQLKAHTAKPK